jgi:hypothetical protein
LKVTHHSILVGAKQDYLKCTVKFAKLLKSVQAEKIMGFKGIKAWIGVADFRGLLDSP